MAVNFHGHRTIELCMVVCILLVHPGFPDERQVFDAQTKGHRSSQSIEEYDRSEKHFIQVESGT